MLRKSLKNMAGKYHIVLANSISHWRKVLLTIVIVAGLLTLGLLLYPRFTALAIVEIGGVLNESDLGIVRLQPYENASDIENFFSEGLSGKTGSALNRRCNAKVFNTPTGLQLHINCSGKSYQQARNMAMAALQPILARHARAYAITKALNKQRIESIERELQRLERVTGSLRKYLEPQLIEKGVNGPSNMNSEPQLLEMRIIDYQLKIENLREKLAVERILGNRVKQTKLETKGIYVIDRKVSPGIWAMVAAMALFSGLFVARFSATPK